MSDLPPRPPSGLRLLAIIAGAVCAGVALIVGALFWIIHSASTIPGPPLPASLKKPRIFLSQRPLTKRVFAAPSGIGEITDLREIGGAVVAAGTDGVELMGLDGKVRGSGMRIRGASGLLTIVPQDNGYLLFDAGNYFRGPRLLDARGVTVWQSSVTHSGMSAAAGVLDPAEPPVIALAYSGSIELRSSNGRRLWSQGAANPWHVEIGDVGGGKNGVVRSDASGNFYIIDRSGKSKLVGVGEYAVLVDSSGKSKALPRAGYISDFRLLHWPDARGQPAVLSTGKGTLFVSAMDGNLLARMPAPPPGPEASDLEVTAACRVSLGAAGAHFAVLANLKGHAGRSFLYVFDAGGQPVYAELLAQSGGALLAVDRKDRPGSQTLLLGGVGSIAAYSAE